MELWIRSKDKEKLVKCNDIVINSFLLNEIPKDEYCYSIIGYFDKETEYEILATYRTKERALEVLDEIQDKIVINYGYELATNSGIRPDNIKPKSYIAVYEMPQD